MSNYHDDFLKRMLRIDRLAEGEALEQKKKFVSLKQVLDEELAKLEAQGFTTIRQTMAINNIRDHITEAFQNINADIREKAFELIEKQIVFDSDMFRLYDVAETIILPRAQVAFDKAFDLPFQGRTFDQWYSGNSQKTFIKARDEIRNGFINGDTRQEISSRVSRHLNNSSNEVKTLVRSSFVSAANEARELMVSENQASFEYKVWSSTLDIRTTPDICGIRDGLKYDLNNQPIGHNIPWLAGPGRMHFNCRSAWFPKVKGLPTTTERSYVGPGDNYQRGDNKTRTGKVRKPNKAAREKGTFNQGSVGSRVKYEGWLRTQPIDFVADALGSKRKAQLFKSGEKLSNLTNRPLGQPLTINQF